ncbi:hypothetical protein L873DRAFT_1815665 [Choiromyces venosus 120613-1]|uniref:Uncharacterized protein n=1 Tax=Choiromyces venosus 120613-1 TaxID=1336337 RepID=A0A3N4J5A8_9PEZI|nr:hypothetical protein L873DRAFT_1815665 [Choiromyces venosus 120613-1]
MLNSRAKLVIPSTKLLLKKRLFSTIAVFDASVRLLYQACSSPNSRFIVQITSLSTEPYLLRTSTRKCLEGLETKNQTTSSASRNNREYDKGN